MRGTQVILLLFCFLLVAVSAALVLRAREDLTAVPSLPPATPAPSETEFQPGNDVRVDVSELFSLPTIETYEETLRRPLFSRSRRPADQPVVATASGGSLEATLIGIISSRAKSLVLLRLDATGEVVQLLEGDRLNGWSLVSVSEAEVVFKSGDEELTLELAFETDLNPGESGQLDPEDAVETDGEDDDIEDSKSADN